MKLLNLGSFPLMVLQQENIPTIVFLCRLLFRLNLVFPHSPAVLLLTLVLMPALARMLGFVQCPYLPRLRCHCQRHIF
jgi:hypothetical protein